MIKSMSKSNEQAKKHGLDNIEKNKANPEVLCSELKVKDKYKAKFDAKNEEVYKNEFQMIAKINYEDPPKSGSKNDFNVYNFNESGIGNSWMLGNDSSISANAYINGKSDCQVNIIVPRNLTNEKGVTKPVEVVGKYAYYQCGQTKSKTKTVLVTKQVKIIRKEGFGAMEFTESFQIEDGSVLETIESNGLESIGYITGQDEAKRRTLTIPSTLSSVSYNGIRNCNLFNVIIYCGSHYLNYSELYAIGEAKATVVKVTSQYPSDTIFGSQTPLKNSPIDVEGNCSRMELKQTPSPTLSSIPSPSSSPSLSLIPTLTPSCNCPRSLHNKATLCLAALFFALLPSHSLYSSSSFSFLTTSFTFPLL